jgi:magnesium-protoporphyrin IX monomethyl ester (oxidative) cyclase
MYIAAVLEKAGYGVEILDAFMTELSFLKNGDVTEVGMSEKRIREEIRRRKPEIVGISNPFTCQSENAVKVAEIAKEVDPDTLTVVGGPHTTVVPLKFLAEAKSVDIAVVGEGEYTMLDIVQQVEERKKLADVQGIAYRKNGKPTMSAIRPFITDLDKLPYPAYHLVDMEQYLNPKGIEYRSFKDRAISMITSRGCPFNCNFCSVHLHMGKMFRAHSPSYVIEHIQFVIEKYRVKTIFFEDDNLTLDRKRFETICDSVIEKNVKFRWETPNGIRADYLTEDLLRKMQKAGCNSIIFAIESGDQWVLDNIIDKSLKLEDAIKVAKTCKKLGLPASAFYIIGFPGEKKENMMKTVNLALKLKRDYDLGMLLHIATPLYGTRLYEECKDSNFIRENLTPRDFAEVRQTRGMPLIETPDFTPKEVREIAVEAFKDYKRISLINYVKNPGKTLKSVLSYPRIVIKFIEDYLGRR